jgi:dTMP kinase
VPTTTNPPSDARGCFVVFEGIEGAGKSTQVARLAAALRARGHRVSTTREPGGTPFGTQVRRLVMHATDAPPAPMAELLLYLADRAQHLEEVIRPALARGEVVLCDRFSGSTIAYQGYGRGLDVAMVTQLDAAVRSGLWPDLTILLDCAVAAGLQRATGDDRLQRESLAFHERVQRGFHCLANADPTWQRIPTDGDVDSVAARVLEAVARAAILPTGGGT